MAKRSVDMTEARQHALISLHYLAGTFGDLDPSKVIPDFQVSTPQEALQLLADAPPEEIPVSARLDVLYRLARSGHSDDEASKEMYRNLAATAVKGRGLDVDTLIADLTVSSRGEAPFGMRASASAFKHRERAFLGENICTVRRVKVGELSATWIFSEFETDAPFEHVAEWVNPENWSVWGPHFFKKMEVVPPKNPLKLGAPGDPHWHGVFLEEVQLFRRLNTLLHCDYWRDGDQAAGMTYDLNFSTDGQIDVDRGFLLVNEVNGMRRVKTLKIVGFTEDVWDLAALFVCPLWTEWARGAVDDEDAKHSTGVPATQTPPSMSPSPLGETLDAWVDFLGDSAQRYLSLFEDTSSRVSAGGYTSASMLDDGRRYWSELAKDWARAWTHGLKLLDDVAEEGLDASFTPPGVPRERGRGAARMATAPGAQGARFHERTVLPVVGLTASDRPSVTDLESIEAGRATIPAGDIAVELERLEDGTTVARLSTTNTTVPAGLYVGYLQPSPDQPRTPVQLYVARTTEA